MEMLDGGFPVLVFLLDGFFDISSGLISEDSLLIFTRETLTLLIESDKGNLSTDSSRVSRN